MEAEREVAEHKSALAIAAQRIAEAENVINANRNAGKLGITLDMLRELLPVFVQALVASQSKQEEVRLAIDKHSGMTGVDLNARETQYLQNQQNIDRVELSDHELENRQREMLLKTIDAYHAVSNTDPARDEKLKILKRSWNIQEKALYDRHNRLIPPTTGEKGKRGVPRGNGGGRFRKAAPPNENRVSPEAAGAESNW